ncbi:MAG: metallopeptidase TldD-related protein [Anaerolineales bacterium]|nr:metallopeptidase TldD-related protein [Anaerolineales bacterium]
MKDKILQTLRDLRAYALSKNVEATFFYHEEDSYLMRFANSAISLNTNEHLIRLEITTYEDRKRASYELITDLEKLKEMKLGVDIAAEMVKHAMPLMYQPTVPTYAESFVDESGYDASLATLSNEERLAYFNKAVEGLETDDIKLSGIFSCGANTTAQINTRSEHAQYFKTSDAQVSIVLSHPTLKWEVIAEQSAQKKSELNPSILRRDLAFLLERYQNDTPQQMPLGKYDIVFGSAATGDLLSMMNYIGFSGGSMKRGFSFISEEQVGKKVFSDKFNLTDDPTRLETFPFKRDMMGMHRVQFPIFENGMFKSFTWYQDDADEFNAKPTGHTVMHKSLVLGGGDKNVSTLEELVKMPRENDILYIPFLHYMNVVNPSKGLVTASSRFGALLLKKDGSVVVPYNVRITQSLLDIFGNKVAWMSKSQVVNNTSQSYGARNPTAIVVPAFIQVNDLEISHSNSSY